MMSYQSSSTQLTREISSRTTFTSTKMTSVPPTPIEYSLSSKIALDQLNTMSMAAVTKFLDPTIVPSSLI
jgi:hypothetical protein